MVVFIILCVIGIILYLNFEHNNRDKQQDYKLTPVYRLLPPDDKLRMEIVLSLENEIKKANSLTNDNFQRAIYIKAVIADKKQMLLKNRVQISNQTNVPLYLVIEIIEECCLGAYTTYVKQ
jgi:nitrogen regulatory protein PII-like uncharacterized protein